MRTLIPLIVLTTVGCGTGLVDTWETRTLEDEGTACLVATTDGGEGTVTVDAQECMSSSCDRNQVASCEATVDGSTITVTASFEWETATGTQACTDDCGQLAADCSTGELAAGTYTLVYGDQSTEFTVPTESGDCDSL